MANETRTYQLDQLTQSATAQNREVSDDQIASRAYERFLQRGGGEGNDIEDWLAAEAELRGAAGISNHPVGEEQRNQAELPERGRSRQNEQW